MTTLKVTAGLAPLQFVVQPSAGVSPVTLRGGFREPQDTARFGNAQSNEITQFDQFRFGPVFGGQFLQGFIDAQENVVTTVNGEIDRIEVHAGQTLTVADAILAAGVVDKYAAHGF